MEETKLEWGQFFGFSSGNTPDESAWFHSVEAAQRFGESCGWENFNVEVANEVNSADIMDTPEKPWHKT